MFEIPKPKLKPNLLRSASVLGIASALASYSMPVLAADEIVVTATKREMGVQDVAQSIEAFTGEELAKEGFDSIRDYVNSIPALSLTADEPGRNTVVYRGISTGTDQYRTDSSVSVYLDEVPMTSISQQVDPYIVDINRLESLPGPQGTLFGSSSQSGTMRIITNKPNHEGITGQISSNVSTTKEGEESYGASGHVNMPLSDSFAVRVVGFYSNEGGYIDNVLGDYPRAPEHTAATDNAAVVEDDFNDYMIYGGRVSALWDVDEDWSVLFQYISQRSEQDGSWKSDPEIGELKIVRFYDENRVDQWWQTAMTITGDLGFAELTSATGYLDRDITYLWDNTIYSQYHAIGDSGGLYDSDYEPGYYFETQGQWRFSQELRLTSKTDSRLQWMIGAFYEDTWDEWFWGVKMENYTLTDSFDYAVAYAAYYEALGYDVEVPLKETDVYWAQFYERSVQQKAIFGELSYDVTDRLQLTAGARWFEFTRGRYEKNEFPLGLPPWGTFGYGGIDRTKGSDSDTVYKFSARYKHDEDRMFYFIYSEGWRIGGSNSARAVLEDFVPGTYDADQLKNYEIGMKSDWFDNRLRLNVSIFMMQWDKIQQSVWGGDVEIDGAFDGNTAWWLQGNVNGGTAETKGIEIYADADLGAGWRFQTSIFSADPEFTEDVVLEDGTEIFAGTPLPVSPKQKAWAAISYTMPTPVNGGEMWFQYDITYQSAVHKSIGSGENIDAWDQSNFKMGLDVEGDWSVGLHINNVWDQRTVYQLTDWDNGSADDLGDARFHDLLTYSRPREIKFLITKKFN